MRYLLSLSLLLCWPAVAQPWLIAGDVQHAPYSFIESDEHTPKGLDVELVGAVLDEAKIDYELRLYPWARVNQMLSKGHVHMAFPFVGTPSRSQRYTLVGPLRSGLTVFMTRRDSPLKDWNQLSDLQPYVIGQVRDFSYEHAFDNAVLQRNINADNPRQLLLMLLAGRVDVIVGDSTQLLHLAREHEAEQQVSVLSKPLAHVPRYVAFAKDDHANAERFAQAMQRLRKSGHLQRIEQRWALGTPSNSI